MNTDAEYLSIACAAVDVAREVFVSHSPGELTAKGDRDMASEADYAVERKVAAFLREHTPQIRFVGEEDGAQGATSELTWALDPIDGTVNFIHGSPLCGTSLALLRGNTPILGIIDLPFLGARYTAAQHLGAFRDGHRLPGSSVTSLGEAVVALGDYAVGDNAPTRNEIRLAITNRLAPVAQRIRMHGSAAIDLAWLAEGRVDAVVIMSNHLWDTAAGVIIAREAGALVVDQHGHHHTSKSSATIAASPHILDELIRHIG